MLTAAFMKLFEGRPRDYDRRMDRGSRGRVRTLKASVSKSVGPGDRVLEVGCGTGELGRMMAARGARVLGFDRNAAMIAVARERAAAAGLEPRLEARRQGLEWMGQLEGGSFDAVVSTLVLSELGPVERQWVLDQAARLVKPGGRVVIADEVAPRSGVVRACRAALRLPIAAASLLVTGAASRPLADLRGEIEATGLAVEAEERSAGDALALVRARRPEAPLPSRPAPLVPWPRGAAKALRTAWSLLFRLFPAPSVTGLRAVGRPGRDSPVLLTCNFHLTLCRLERALRGRDAWLVVADSKGVNVWCAAGGQELDAEAAASALVTSGVAHRVDHHTVLIPPLCAPGVRAVDLEDRTGFTVRWGPVRAADLPRFFDAGSMTDEAMRRATDTWRERLDAGIGSMFPFYLLGAGGFALLAPALLPHYLVVSLGTLAGLVVAAPWLPGRTGLGKALMLQLPLAALLLVPSPTLRAAALIAMGSLLAYSADIGGMSATLPSEFDPLMARLGVERAGNVRFAGTVRTDLLLGRRRLRCDEGRCVACGTCEEICPLAVWSLDTPTGKAAPLRLEHCTACTACIVQCPEGAITADPETRGAA